MFKILLNNKEIQLYKSFTINKSLSNFVDTFQISLSNPWWLYSRTIPIGCYINVFWDDIEIFRWICEKKDVTYDSVGSTLNFSWREELLLLTEDDISPLQKAYKKVSDNFIIKDVCKWYGWKFDLANEKIITEYEIPNSWARKGQVLDDVVSQNNFYLYKIWDTIYKKELPKESDYTKRNRPQFTLATQWWWFVNYNNRLLNVSISEDISNCKSTLKWFTYWTWKAKPKIATTVENKHLLNGTYPQRLRNVLEKKLTAPAIKRFVSKSVDVKNKKELNLIMEKTKVQQDIQIDLKISISEFLDLHILDTVEVFIQDEWIKQYFRIKEITYNYDSSNKWYTEYNMTPIIWIENEAKKYV